ncbi:ATP-binding protein [[Ruminococcus] lactaris]|uniref:ATP-binding protein n=1 Tax=[Ruminococcus] lactaris TaxID=46228 RepID=UPI0035217D44
MRCKFYIDNYGSETFIAKKKDNERAEYIRSADIEDIKAEVIEAAINEARKEVIRLLGGVISGMNVGQPVIMQAANSEAQEPTEDVMDDADVAGLAMRWMSKGD